VYDRRSRVFNQFGAHRAPLQQPLAINSHLLSLVFPDIARRIHPDHQKFVRETAGPQVDEIFRHDFEWK
ncbi:MAG: hypothetical protein ACRD3T_03125, partial [Terriglobia bacterium]